MTKNLWNSLLASPAIFTAMLVTSSVLSAAANPVLAQEKRTTPEVKATLVTQVPDGLEAVSPANPSVNSQDTMAQVTSVSQLSDVQPTD